MSPFCEMPEGAEAETAAFMDLPLQETCRWREFRSLRQIEALPRGSKACSLWSVSRRILMLTGALLLLLSGPASVRRAPAAEPLRLATWNMEWLLTPETEQAARLACRAGHRTALPCDVALEQARDSADLAQLARHARLVGADVFAFQEVESVSIAQRVFKGYDICIAPGRGVQHVGFAVRRSLAHRCGQPV